MIQPHTSSILCPEIIQVGVHTKYAEKSQFNEQHVRSGMACYQRPTEPGGT